MRHRGEMAERIDIILSEKMEETVRNVKVFVSFVFICCSIAFGNLIAVPKVIRGYLRPGFNMAHAFTGNDHQGDTIGINQGGPHGLGDPNDRRLRKVEAEVLIPKIMRERAKAEKCIPEVNEFETCCKGSGLFMAMKCQKENEALRLCSLKWYNDENFRAECREIYLTERSEYRRTGIPKKFRNMNLETPSQ